MEKIDLAQMPLEELVSYHERVLKIVDDRIAAEQADLEKRKAKLEKLITRLASKAAAAPAKVAPAPGMAAPAPSMPAAPKGPKKAGTPKAPKTPDDGPQLAAIVKSLDMPKPLSKLPKAPSFASLMETPAEATADKPAEKLAAPEPEPKTEAPKTEAPA